MNQRYCSPLNSADRPNSGGSSNNSNLQPQRLSPHQTNNRLNNFPRTSPDNFSDFVPLDNSSPVQARGRGHRAHWRGQSSSGYNSNFSPYNSNRTQKFSPHNRSYNSHRSQKYSPQNNRGNHHSGNRSFNSNLKSWYDPSMVEDPWAALEMKQQQQQESPDVPNQSFNAYNSDSPYNVSPQTSKSDLYTVSENSSCDSRLCNSQSMLEDPWAELVEQQDLLLDLGGSSKSFEVTGIQTLGPSKSEKDVRVSSPSAVVSL